MGGFIAGMGQGFTNWRRREFEVEMENRRNLAELYMKMATDPSIRPEAKKEMLTRAQTIYTLPIYKKMPTSLKDPTTALTVQQEVPLNQGGMTPQQGAPAVAAPKPPEGIAPLAGGDGGGPLAAGGGASPGVLQGGAKNLPPAPPMPPGALQGESLGLPTNIPLSPSPLLPAMPPPMPSQPVYTGPLARNGVATQSVSAFRSPEEMIGIEASRSGALTKAQIQAQIEGKYAALMTLPGMDPQRAAMMASGMVGMMKSSGVNVILDDGKHQAATKVFDPTDFRYHYYVGDQDVTDRVTGTATSAASQTAWPKGDMTSVQLVPNGRKWYPTDSDAPPEAKAWFAAQKAGKGSTVVGEKTDAAGNVTKTVTRRTPGSAPPAPPAGVSAPSPSKGGATGAGNSRSNGLKRQLATGQITLNDIKNLKDRETVRAQMAAEGTTIMPKMSASTTANTEAQVAALDNSITLIQNVRKNLPVLNSMISAGKISMAISPDTKELVISRLADLSPKEEELAADFQSLSEHINTLRGPLGATGFRGPEAFQALMSQRGRLLADPKITDRVLQTTLSSMQKIKQAKAKYLPGAEAGSQGGGGGKDADYDFDPVTHTLKPRAPAPPK